MVFLAQHHRASFNSLRLGTGVHHVKRHASMALIMDVLPQVYSQIYINGDPYNTSLANTPFATNYSSPIIHSCIVSNLKPGTACEPWPTTPPRACFQTLVLDCTCLGHRYCGM